MTKLIRCDVCEAEEEIEAVNWIEIKIPGVHLGVDGDSIQQVDVCSMRCISLIGTAQEEEAPEPVVAPRRPQPVQMDAMTDDTGVEKRNRIR